MADELLNIVCVPFIVVIVYIVMAVFKHFVKDKNEAWARLIPIWAAILGAALGIYAFYKVPQLWIADNVFTALLLGIALGLTAVGLNQIKRQISKIGQAPKSTKTIKAIVTTTTETENGTKTEAEETTTTETSAE